MITDIRLYIHILNTQILFGTQSLFLLIESAQKAAVGYAMKEGAKDLDLHVCAWGQEPCDWEAQVSCNFSR